MTTDNPQEAGVLSEQTAADRWREACEIEYARAMDLQAELEQARAERDRLRLVAMDALAWMNEWADWWAADDPYEGDPEPTFSRSWDEVTEGLQKALATASQGQGREEGAL